MNNHLILICLFLPFINGIKNHTFEMRGDNPMKINIKSAAFSEGEMIPLKYTCDGDDVSPPLSWDSVPAGTESFALICDDPDAPVGTWVHWVVYDLPKETRFLHEDFTDQSDLEDGTKQGITDFKRIGYGGPCPPGGTHRYFFKLYALDKKLNEKSGLNKNQLLKAMKGHILGECALIGKYKRTK
jgi:hypothetical protein